MDNVSLKEASEVTLKRIKVNSKRKHLLCKRVRENEGTSVCVCTH